MMQTEDQPLLFDLAAAAERPSDSAVSQWASSQRIFISSVMSGMEQERQAVAREVRSLGTTPVLFEAFGGRDSDPEQAYLAEVASSDIYVGILGRRYGKQLPTRYSATHAEFLEAETIGLRICVWTGSDGDREGHQQSFLDDLRVFYVVPPYKSAEDLGQQVRRRLVEVAAEELSPWVKLGRALFRARVVEDRGETIHIEATVKDAAVVSYLESLRPDQWSRGTETWLSWPSRAKKVSITEIRATTRASRAADMHMVLSVGGEQTDPRHQWAEVSTQGYGPEDLTEVALRVVLFGEPNPLGNQSFLATIPDPFANLRSAQVPEESLRPIARLLLHEVLVRTGRAARLVTFSMGLRVRGKRPLTIGWMPRQQYTNVIPQARGIDGSIDL